MILPTLVLQQGAVDATAMVTEPSEKGSEKNELPGNGSVGHLRQSTQKNEEPGKPASRTRIKIDKRLVSL